MKRHVHELEARLGALSLRERAVVLLLALGLVFLVWDTLLMRPASLQNETRASTVQTIETRLETLRETEARVRGALDGDLHADKREREALLSAQIATLENRIHSELSELVAPDEMPALLEELLGNLPAVQVVRLEALQAVPLIEAGDGESAALYAHGMRVEIEASYADAVDFVSQIEALPWSIFWDELAYEVTEYPRARVVVVVHTLGAAEGWLGV